MTSESEAMKTNEFLRRRKLRLQQVREQSKDIAKKLRQRANEEKLQHIEELKNQKGKEYLKHQEKLVKRLEQLYTQGVKSVGVGHNQASAIQNNVSNTTDKEDLSKIRGREAVAEVRKLKQAKLNQQKKILDRKLLAREAANEISREKVSSVANKIIEKPVAINHIKDAPSAAALDAPENDYGSADHKVNKNDMATQWDSEELPYEWEPNVPALSLPKDDRESVKESNNVPESRSERSKQIDLFALSSEMPSSLRGGLSNISQERTNLRPSLTMVSEYLQNRALRLREHIPTKKQVIGDDLHSLKQTILQTRSSKLEANKNVDKSAISSDAALLVNRKNSVTMYNHSTKNSTAIPYGEPDLVVRDSQTEEDAYAKALKEISTDNAKEKEHLKKLQEMRSKIAMTKQTVEKEYNDTMSFLKSMPKDKCSKHLRTSHMDEKRQQMQKERQQLKLQNEFNKIERESRKNSNMPSKCKVTSINRKKSKSPVQLELNDDFESRDLQYSWMPVPESDGNLAIHTIPTTLKEGKSGNTVKFSKVDSYHEYRSRHKHTPPTKDTSKKKHTNHNNVETIIIQKDESETLSQSTSSSDTSSVENLNLHKKKVSKPEQRTSDEENIIIYKIQNAKISKKLREKKRLKLIDDVAKVINAMDREKIIPSNKDNNNNKGDSSGMININSSNNVPFEQINEGMYKVVNEKGDNMTSLFISDKLHEDNNNEFKKPCLCKKSSNQNQLLIEDTDHHSGSGDERIPRTTKCWVCKNGSVSNLKSGVEQSSGPHPTAVNSTSSFKTATMNEKNAMLDGDFIKLLDDNGRETGKFYIGASGVLKGDAYEITIQLKKKETVRKEENLESGKGLNENMVPKEVFPTHSKSKISVNLSVPSAEPISIVESDKPNDNTFPETESTVCPSKGSTWQSSNLQDNMINKAAPEKDINEPLVDSREDKVEKTCKKYVDKGVYTASQLSFAVPCDYPKTDDAPRPATSTYTQTSINSPNTRPVYIHMSSSTSTAYMSPPEMILPKYLKENFTTYNQHEATRSQDKMYEKTGHHDCDQNSICMCRQCLLYEKLTINKVNAKDRKIKTTKSCSRKTSTPPNTARDYVNTSLEMNSKSSPKVHKQKCRKCDSRGTSSTDIKCRNRKFNVLNKLSFNNFAMRSATNTSKLFQNNINEKVRKSNLNPVIKNYVKKLLELNNNGLKAIEIANQECSSVSTPGSSVIEVSHNINKDTDTNNKISLEQVKMLFKEKILEDCIKSNTNIKDTLHVCHNKRSKYNISKMSRPKRSVHKIKSLNISKKIMKSKKSNNNMFPIVTNRTTKPCSTSSPSSTGISYVKKSVISKPTNDSTKRTRSRSSPTPRYRTKLDSSNDNTGSDMSEIQNCYDPTANNKNNRQNNRCHVKYHKKPVKNTTDHILPLHKATLTSPDSDNNVNDSQIRSDLPTNTSTQTNQDVDSEINFIKMAEDKIQNMEKIADLTEKCTKRLSNLAKILEEVRKNKSLAYSHISTSDTASDYEQKSDKDKNIDTTLQQTDPIIEVQKESHNNFSHAATTANENEKSLQFISFLKDIPKPEEYKLPDEPLNIPMDIGKPKTVNSNQLLSKIKSRPPPALSRINLKHGQEIIPHELSTVVEVDSPMSMKLKNQSSKGEDIPDASNQSSSTNVKKAEDILANPDLLQNSNSVVSKSPTNNGVQDEPKIQMMDIKQFDEVMLKPFISLQEYAKQCDFGILDEGSNMDDVVRDDLVNEELSSLHSDGSLPDVIAELLKRNIIAEPFKFDALSNVNSTTVSSESTLSVLALSKVRNNKKKSKVIFQNKENISETSDTLSISSNPDLENAFKKLGMGWASSTLKKTKERLALSSSSTTSSSSISQFKAKNLNNQDIPALVTDSVLSVSKTTRRKKLGKDSIDTAKNAEQQTSFQTSMTVKEFLTNELAKKITFTNKSHRNESDEEFVSLLETKMPEEMKLSSQNLLEEHSVDSLPSGSNNRARTSTPVQIFKSMTYRSSSSSNLSNGLFSNADDLSSVKVTSNSMRNHSTSDKGDLTIPNCSLKVRKGASDCSKSD